MNTEELSPITVSKTEKHGEAVLMPPSADMAKNEAINPYETHVKLNGHPIDMRLEDISMARSGSYGPYAMRLVQADKAYAIAHLRDGLSIVDMNALDETAADLKDRPLSDDPIENALSRGGESILAHDMSTERLEDGEELVLGDESHKIVMKLKDGIVHIETETNDEAETKLFYEKYQTGDIGYIGPFNRESMDAHTRFEDFKKKAEARRKKTGRLLGRFASRSVR